MSVAATLLGTGTSTGIPIIGCDCRVCTSSDPHDKRLRVSAHIVASTEQGPIHLQIDTGPDFREQALRFGIGGVDAVLYTHAHFDHVVGADDLRPFLFENRTPIPCYASEHTARYLQRILSYIFEDGNYPGVVQLTLNTVASEPFEVTTRNSRPPTKSGGSGAGATVIPIPALHGTTPVLGFRIGRLAYLTDVNEIPDTSLELLEDLDVLVLDALRRKPPHHSHFTIGEAIEMAQKIEARDTVFVHMTHTVLHAEEDVRLPDGIRLGYDGLELEARL